MEVHSDVNRPNNFEERKQLVSQVYKLICRMTPEQLKEVLRRMDEEEAAKKRLN